MNVNDLALKMQDVGFDVTIDHNAIDFGVGLMIVDDGELGIAFYYDCKPSTASAITYAFIHELGLDFRVLNDIPSDGVELEVCDVCKGT